MYDNFVSKTIFFPQKTIILSTKSGNTRHWPHVQRSYGIECELYLHVCMVTTHHFRPAMGLVWYCMVRYTATIREKNLCTDLLVNARVEQESPRNSHKITNIPISICQLCFTEMFFHHSYLSNSSHWLFYDDVTYFLMLNCI